MMQRVAIFGSPGSGKSTLARQLSALTGLPVIHLDRYYFDRGWIPKPDAVLSELITELTAADRWISDGNYISNSAHRIERADTLILLYAPRLRCLWRVIWRSVRYYGQVRPHQATGCPERFDWTFWKFVWTFPAKSDEIRQLLIQLSGRKAVYFLSSPADVDCFLGQYQTVSHHEPS